MRMMHIGESFRMLVLDDCYDRFIDCELTTECIRIVCNEDTFAVCVRYVTCVPIAIFYPQHIYVNDMVRVEGDERIHGDVIITGYDESTGPRSLTEFEEKLIRSRLELRRVGSKTILVLKGVTKHPSTLEVE